MTTQIGRRVARRFAETMLYWRGFLRARDIQDFLGVSERTARALMGDWRAEGLLAPYRADAARRSVPFEGFDPGAPVADSNAAFSLLLDTNAFPGNPFGAAGPASGGHDLWLAAKAPPGPVREIVAACLERRPIRLLYAAKTGRQEFAFCPAAVVRARGRYHLRGYRSEGRALGGGSLDSRYVDVVPARAVEAESADDVRFVDLAGDTEWRAWEEARFVLSPTLTDDERICHEHEYGIAETGVLKVRQRRALMHYVREELAERRCWRRDGSSTPIWRAQPLP